MLDKQKMFNACVRGLAKQEWRRSAESPHIEAQCLYRGPEGIGCAIGVLIPKEIEIADAHNSDGIYQLLDSYPEIHNFLKAEFCSDSEHDDLLSDSSNTQFLRDLQHSHDQASSRTDMINKFSRLANDHLLDWPADVSKE